MADIFFPNAALSEEFDIWRDNAGTIHCDLYSNDYTPVVASVAGDFTAASYSGYAQQIVDVSGTIMDDGTNGVYLDTADLTFPLAGSGTQVCYGYFLRDGSGVIVAARRFDGAVTVSTTNRVSTFFVRLRRKRS